MKKPPFAAAFAKDMKNALDLERVHTIRNVRILRRFFKEQGAGGRMLAVFNPTSSAVMRKSCQMMRVERSCEHALVWRVLLFLCAARENAPHSENI